MPEIQGVEKLISYSPAKRMGKHREFGRGMFAFSDYGEDDLYLVLLPFGVASFGQINYGEHLIFSGIFRRNNATGKVKYYRQPYYTPKNPRSGPQQTQREKMTNGVSAWQALTSSQQAVYNKNAIGKGMSGYNLFLKQHLLSN